MKIKHIVLSVAVTIGAAVNVYLANDIRELTNNLSLLTLENIAEAQEGNPGDAGWASDKGELTFDEKDCIKGEGPGYDPNGTYHSRMEYVDVFYYCTGTPADKNCTPRTERHYSYGG